MTTHLYCNYRRPQTLMVPGTTTALSACSVSVPVSQVTLVPEQVTCRECRERFESHERREDVSTPDVEEMTGPQLVAAYNALLMSAGKKSISKFRDLESGRRRLRSEIAMTERAEEILRAALPGTEAPVSAVNSVSVVNSSAPAAAPTKTVKTKKEKTSKTEKTATNSSAPKRERTHRSGIPLAAEIVVLDKTYKGRGATSERWARLAGGSTVTVGEYCDRIGTIGDVKWWIKDRRVTLRKRS